MSDRISFFLLIALLSSWVPSFLVGALSDKIKAWKVFIATKICSLTSLVIFVISVPKQDHIYTKDDPMPLTMTITFILNFILTATSATINITLLTKSLTTCALSRGVFMGAAAFCMSCGILLINGLGGNIYDLDKRSPFFIVIGSESLLVLIAAALAMRGQLKL